MFPYSTVVPIVRPRKETTQCNLCGVEKGAGKMFRCRGCKIHAYCCRAHQKKDWKNHKAMCKEVQALDGKKMRKSKSLTQTFGNSITTYIQKTFTAQDFPEVGKIYRATKRDGSFYIHPLSMKEFFQIAKSLMKDEVMRKAFLCQEFESLKQGNPTFVIFSTQTKAHAIVSAQRL